jgi:hypothetical protein
MTAMSIDPATGTFLRGGARVFPIVLSDPPPVGSTAPQSGIDAWDEVRNAGVNFVRDYTAWDPLLIDQQLRRVGPVLDAAEAHGLQVWLGLGGAANSLNTQALLDRILGAFKSHPGLGAWKGPDEPAHGHLAAPGCVAAFEHLRTVDPSHPVVIIQAPRGPGPNPQSPDIPLTVEAVAPYAAACDVHGVDIYPVPPGAHAGGPPVNTDISVVGDMTRIVASATHRPALWTTLQIAWSGVLPPHQVLFPTLPQARFMAYDAVIAGARGLAFFGGHLTGAMNDADRQLSWNWTYWHGVLRPLLEELTDAAHAEALTAPSASHQINANAPDVAHATRQAGGHLYLIAARRSPHLTGPVRFSGLPVSVGHGTVLPHPGGNPARQVTVRNGAFTDPSPYAPHNARVYRF